jgi:hypothetical protein
MNEPRKQGGIAFQSLVALLLFVGLTAIAGGIGLIVDPSGSMLRIPITWIEGSPFNNYLIPGVILLAVLGVFPLAVAYGLRKRLRWSWYGALLVGAMLIVWLAVQVLVVGYQPAPPLQFVYGVAACLILFLSLTPGVLRAVRSRVSGDVVD